MERRRRTDRLRPLADPEHSSSGRERAARVCAALGEAGFDGVSVVDVPVHHTPGVLDPLVARAATVGRAVDDERGGARAVAFPAWFDPASTSVVLVADPHLARRDIDAIAIWGAPPQRLSIAATPVEALAYDLAVELGADAFVSALFARSGVLVELHARTGALTCRWRVPMESVWAEAARHGVSYVLGELQHHQGAEALASLGFRQAAVVGLDNGNGIAIGAIGVASRSRLADDIADQLLERAPALGPVIMRLRSTTLVPHHGSDGTVDLAVLAARIGCDRCSTWGAVGTELRPIAAHDRTGSPVALDPDGVERDVVGMAAARGTATSAGRAAAVPIGDGAVLYAFDAYRDPMERIRLALHDLRHDPFGAGETAA